MNQPSDTPKTSTTPKTHGATLSSVAPEVHNTHESPSGFRPIPKYLRWVALISGVLMLALAVSMYKAYTDVIIGEHETTVKWLPERCSDVSYYRSYHYTAYEFKLPEADFLDWAKSADWKLKPIETPITFGRYTAGEKFQRKPEDSLDHTTRRGHLLERTNENGGHFRVIYDLDNGYVYSVWKPM